MFSFLAEFTRGLDSTYTIIVMDEEGLEQPRQHRVMPRNVLLLLGGAMLGFGLLLVGLVVLTPLRTWIPGYGTEEMRQGARMNSLRLTALQDSLEAQQEYMSQLRKLVMGEIDSAFVGSAAPAPEPGPGPVVAGGFADMAEAPPSQDWNDHRQPAVPIVTMPVESDIPFRVVSAGTQYLSSLQFPVVPPVEGFFTRSFDARIGHFAVDIAVQEGTMVRSIGDGYVILADWTHDGGYAIAVQHAEGYVSVYKHNRRLLKRVGDRVRARDIIAASGNSGEITTGPHLHFELWHDGLAQDPRYYFIGG